MLTFLLVHALNVFFGLFSTAVWMLANAFSASLVLSGGPYALLLVQGARLLATLPPKPTDLGTPALCFSFEKNGVKKKQVLDYIDYIHV